jgi:MFS family permease
VAAAIADLVEPELRTEAYGLQRQVGSVAFALGPPVGALLTLGLPLRALWLVGGVAGLGALAVVWRGLPETRPERGEHEPPPRLRVAARDRRLLALALGAGLATIVYVQFDAVLGVFLHRDRGYALAAWGFLFGINPILIGLLQYPVARWAGRHSPRAMLALGAVLQGAALFSLWPWSGVPLLVAAIGVLTLGEMIMAPVASATAARLAPPHLRGSYEGVTAVALAASYAPGTFIGLWLVGAGHGELMLVLALPLALAAALCFARLPSGYAA